MGKTGYFLEIPKILHFSVPYTQDIKLNDISQKWSVQHKSCFTQHWVHGSVESWIFLHLKGVHPSVSPRFENSPPYQLLSPHVSHQLSPKFSSIPTVQFLCTHCWVPSSLPYPLFSPYVPTVALLYPLFSPYVPTVESQVLFHTHCSVLMYPLLSPKFCSVPTVQSLCTHFLKCESNMWLTLNLGLKRESNVSPTRGLSGTWDSNVSPTRGLPGTWDSNVSPTQILLTRIPINILWLKMLQLKIK